MPYKCTTHKVLFQISKLDEKQVIFHWPITARCCFSIPPENRKLKRFSNVFFRGYRKATLGCNGLRLSSHVKTVTRLSFFLRVSRIEYVDVSWSTKHKDIFKVSVSEILHWFCFKSIWLIWFVSCNCVMSDVIF